MSLDPTRDRGIPALSSHRFAFDVVQLDRLIRM